MRNRKFTAEQATLAIQKTAKLLAQESVSVTTRGARAFIEWFPSGEIKRINLPMVPRDADQQFLDALQGFLDHEVGHALHTNPLRGRAREDEFIKESGVRPQVIRGMANIVEDVRIEAAMEKQFAGSKRNLEAVRKFFVERMQKPTLEAIDPSPKYDDERRAYILPIFFRARGGQTACEHFMDDMDLWKYVEPYDELFPDLPERLKALGSTLDAVELAIEIVKKTNETTPPDSDEADQGENEDTDSDCEPDQDQQDPQEGDDGDDEQGNDPGEQSETDESDQSQDEDDGDQQDDGGESDDRDEDGQADSDGEDDSDDDDDQGSGQSDDESDDDGAEDEPEPSDEGGAGDDESEDEAEPEDGDGDEGGESDPDEDATEDDNSDDAGSGDDGGEDPDDSERDDGEQEDGSEPSDGSDDGSDPGDDDLNEDVDGEEADGEASEDGDSDSKIYVPVDYDSLKDFDDAAAEELEKMVGEIHTDDPYHVFSRDLDVVEHCEAWSYAPVVEYENKVEKTTGVLRKELQRLIAARSMSHMVPGKRSGRLHTSSLHRLRVGDDRVFARKHEVQSKNTAVSLVVDCSGSMSGKKIVTAMEAAWAFADTLTRLNVKNEVVGFTTLRAYYDGLKSGTYDYSEVCRYAATMGVSEYAVRHVPLYMPIFKDFNENFGIDQKRRMAGYAKFGERIENVDGECVRIAAHRLLQQRADRHVMIVFSDGYPSGGPAENLLRRDLKNAVKEMEAARIETIGVGIHSNAVKEFYPKSVVITDSAQLAGATMRELKAILTN